MTRLLVVTAAAAERDAVARAGSGNPAIGMVDGLEVHRTITKAGLTDVVTSGVGPAAASVATSCALRNGYDLVIAAGVAGGFPATEVGSVVLANAVVHADLGAETENGFTSMAELGWSQVRFETDPALVAAFNERVQALVGAVLTVSTVTGSQTRADELRHAHPDALAEAMEGVGVYLAASRVGVPFAEIRAISNRIGPRDRDAWHIAGALESLTAAFTDLLATPLDLSLGVAP